MKFPLKLIKNIHSSSDISYLLIDANKENILSMTLPDTLEVEEIIRRANEYDYLAKEVMARTDYKGFRSRSKSFRRRK